MRDLIKRWWYSGRRDRRKKNIGGPRRLFYVYHTYTTHEIKPEERRKQNRPAD